VRDADSRAITQVEQVHDSIALAIHREDLATITHLHRRMGPDIRDARLCQEALRADLDDLWRRMARAEETLEHAEEREIDEGRVEAWRILTRESIRDALAILRGDQ
jgi:hypothetical protein